MASEIVKNSGDAQKHWPDGRGRDLDSKKKRGIARIEPPANIPWKLDSSRRGVLLWHFRASHKRTPLCTTKTQCCVEIVRKSWWFERSAGQCDGGTAPPPCVPSVCVMSYPHHYSQRSSSQHKTAAVAPISRPIHPIPAIKPQCRYLHKLSRLIGSFPASSGIATASTGRKHPHGPSSHDSSACIAPRLKVRNFPL